MPKNTTFGKLGVFIPQHPEKYKGELPIIYRSNLEYKFCKICDLSSNIIEWGSESFYIEYFNTLENKMSKYYPDFFIKIKIDDKFFIYIIEIKDSKFLEIPEKPERFTKQKMANYYFMMKEYLKNIDKIKAAQEFCNKNNLKYIIITEKTINNFLKNV